MPAPNRDSIRRPRSAATAEKLVPDPPAPSNRPMAFHGNAFSAPEYRDRSASPTPPFPGTTANRSDARPVLYRLAETRSDARTATPPSRFALAANPWRAHASRRRSPPGAAMPPTPLPRCSDPPDYAASIRRRAVVPRPTRPAPRRGAAQPSGRPDRPAARRRSARSTSRLCDTAIRRPDFEPPGWSPGRRCQSAKSLALSLHDPRARRRGGISIPTSDFLVDRL